MKKMENLKILLHSDRYNDIKQQIIFYLPLQYMHLCENTTELQYYWEAFWGSMLGMVAKE